MIQVVEREALLGLCSYFDNDFSWKVETDCYECYGVQCKSSIGRVVQLDLFVAKWNSYEQYINYLDFLSSKI